MFSIAVCAAFARLRKYFILQEELNDANKRKSSNTTQNGVVNLNKISGLYPITYPTLIKQDTLFLLRLILNPPTKGLHCMPPSPSDVWTIETHPSRETSYCPGSGLIGIFAISSDVFL
jgi:hypothetical protein